MLDIKTAAYPACLSSIVATDDIVYVPNMLNREGVNMKLIK